MNFVQFYLDQAPDYKGRMLHDIWSWSHEKLELSHDFIQLLFPLKERSESVPTAPVIDDDSIQQFRTNPQLQRNMLKSLELMLCFYGLRRAADGMHITKDEHFPERAPEWVILGDHNHLRLTRILRCLALCGLSEHARALLECLQHIAAEHPEAISQETRQYWTKAASA